METESIERKFGCEEERIKVEAGMKSSQGGRGTAGASSSQIPQNFLAMTLMLGLDQFLTSDPAFLKS